MVYCNNRECMFYGDQQCQTDRVYYINRLCVTFRKRPHDEMRQLMDSPFKSNCHRQGGKYVSKRGEVLK